LTSTSRRTRSSSTASVADVEAFRGSGPSSEQQAAIRDAEVYQHVVESSERL